MSTNYVDPFEPLTTARQDIERRISSFAHRISAARKEADGYRSKAYALDDEADRLSRMRDEYEAILSAQRDA